MIYLKKYYRKDGKCLMRTGDLKCTEIRLPDKAEDKLPLILQTVTFLNKDDFDKVVGAMEEVDEKIFDQYLLAFIGRVDVDIKTPMSEKSIQKELQKAKEF